MLIDTLLESDQELTATLIDTLIEEIKIDTSIVIEHLNNWKSVVSKVLKYLKPNGKIIFSTINRTLHSKIFAILFAEKILKLIQPLLASVIIFLLGRISVISISFNLQITGKSNV